LDSGHFDKEFLEKAWQNLSNLL